MTVRCSRAEAAGEFLLLTTGESNVQIPWAQCSAKLAAASGEEREQLRLSPSGYGIHWPRIDEDLSVRGLIAVPLGHRLAVGGGGDEHSGDETRASREEGRPLDGGAAVGLVHGDAQAGDADDEADDGRVVTRGH